MLVIIFLFIDSVVQCSDCQSVTPISEVNTMSLPLRINLDYLTSLFFTGEIG